MNVLEARRRLLGRNVYKRPTEGNPAIAQGSLARMYPGITMQGWTEQAQYEGKNLFDLNGVEYNKMINVLNGTISDNVSYSVSPYIPVKPNTIYSRTYNSISGNVLYDSEKQYISNVAGGGTIRTTENAAYLRLNLPNSISFVKDTIVNEGSTLLPYEPYTGGQPSPSPEYPQPITSAGKYNEDTQKWEYEITIANEQTDPDKNQTVTLTADRPLTKWDKLEKRNGQWGWVYGSAKVDMSSEVTWAIHPGYEQETSNLFRGAMSGVDKIDPDKVFCTILPYHQTSSADVNGIYSLSNYLFARIVGIKSLEDFREKIQGGKVLAKLSTETFVPLTSSEQEAMNALHTYRPTTVLSNQQDCDMTLTYKTRKGMN